MSWHSRDGVSPVAVAGKPLGPTTRPIAFSSVTSMAHDAARERPASSPRALDAESYPSPGRVRLDQRGPWHAEFREDLGRYRAHHGGSRIKPFLMEQGLWALLQYRLASAVHRSALPAPVKLPLLALAVVTQKLTELLTGAGIPYSAQLYPGQYIGHFGPLLINGDAVIGAGCNFSQGVTIGVSGRGDRRGCPVIEPRVYLGANAVVVGRITVGAGSVVGANSTVIRDVAAGTTVLGVPATVLARQGTGGMGLHQNPVPIRSRRRSGR